MKKNTVITIVIAALLCLVLLGMNPAIASPAGDAVRSGAPTLGDTETIVENMRNPQKVTFLSDGISEYRALFIDEGKAFGELLPVVPEKNGYESVGWLKVGTAGEYLGKDTPVNTDLTVTADYKALLMNYQKEFSANNNGISVTVTVPADSLPTDAELQMNDVPLSSNNVKAIQRTLIGENKTGPIKAFNLRFFNKKGEQIIPQKTVSIKMDVSGFEMTDKLAVLQISDKWEITISKADIEDKSFVLDGISFVSQEGKNVSTFAVTYPKEGLQALTPEYALGSGAIVVSWKNGMFALLAEEYAAGKLKGVDIFNADSVTNWTFIPTDKTWTTEEEFADGPKNVTYKLYQIQADNGKYLQVTNNGVYLSDAPVETIVRLNVGQKGNPPGMFQLLSEGASNKLSDHRAMNNKLDNNKSNYFYRTISTPAMLAENDDQWPMLYYLDNPVEVRFDIDPGIGYPAPTAMRKLPGSTITMPSYSGIHAEGHLFKGWSKTRGAEVPEFLPGWSYTVEEDVTFYAVWQPIEESSVTFCLDKTCTGETMITKKSGLVGERIKLSEIGNELSNGSHTLKGWSYDIDADKPEFSVDGEFILGGAPKKLYPVWDIILTFVYSDTKTVEQKYEFDVEYINLPVGKDSDSTLAWWEDTSENGKRYLPGSPFVPIKDTTFRAIWGKNTTLIFDPNGAETPKEPLSIETWIYAEIQLDVYYNLHLKFNNREHKLLGWAEAGSSEPTYEPDATYTVSEENKTLYAIWDDDVYVRYFNVKRQELSDYGRHYTLADRPETITMPSEEISGQSDTTNYKFLGWTAKPDNYGEEDLYKGQIQAPVKDVDLYPVWQKAVTITFDSNGGSETPSALTPVFPGESFTLPTAGSRGDEYRQLGWSVNKNAKTPDEGYAVLGPDGAPITTAVVPNKSVKLFAVWQKQVPVKFISDNTVLGTFNGFPGDEKFAGTKIYFNNITNFGTADPAYLLGWSSINKMYDISEAYYTVLADDIQKNEVKLQAVWQGNITIHFDTNEGSGSVSDMTNVSYGSFIVVPEYDGTREGYKFLGWSERKDYKEYSNKTKTYYSSVYKPANLKENGESGDLYRVMDKKDITLYAFWSEDRENRATQIKFGIRMDGTVPDEPGTYDKSLYSTAYDGGNDFIDNLKNLDQDWLVDTHTDTSALGKSKDGTPYYQINAITEFLGGTPDSVPSLEKVKEMYGSDGEHKFIPGVHYVLWYVLKYQNHEYWHVDGVVKHIKSAINVTYSQGDLRGVVNNMPLGYEIQLGEGEHSADITVGSSGKATGGTVRVPNAVGYTFMGWKVVSKDAPEDGSITYTNNIYTTDRDVEFVAQWSSPIASSKVIKDWQDAGLENSRPGSVNVELHQKIDNKTVSKITRTLNAANGWTAQVSPLPVYDKNGAEYTYEWVESNVPSGYFYDAHTEEIKDNFYQTTITNSRTKITVKADSDEKIFDGTALTKSTAKVISGQLRNGDRLVPDIIGSQTEVGSAVNTLRTVKIMHGNSDVTDTYVIQKENGNLEVTPRVITVKANDNRKTYGEKDPVLTASVYDGENLLEDITCVNGNCSVKTGIGDDTITYNIRRIAGEDVEPPVFLRYYGSVENNDRTPGYKIMTYGTSEQILSEMQGKNYKVVYLPGKFVIEPRPDTIARTSRSVSKVWDDRDNAAGTRPSSLLVTLRNGSTTVFSTRLNEENGWHAVVSNLPVLENGSSITYTWYEQAVGGGYRAVSSTTSSDGNTTLVNSNLYTVTIHYRYADGTRVFDSYTDRLPVGASFSVASPALRGYTPSQASVTGTMPAHDVEFIVIYTPEGQPVVTPTPVPTVQPEEPHKDIPHPRDLDPDADHPLVVPMPNILVEIDDLNTALGLGEVVSSNHGFALE